MINKKIEICANSLESALLAEQGGANRVELCAGMPEGGTTPSYGTIKLTCEQLLIPVHVIIRPRGGDFLYSTPEQDVMLQDIETARDLGAKGIVIGCLTAAGDVDMSLMRRLMERRGEMSVTFHRAFDMCRDPRKALEDIIELGCDRILTSGQQATAEKGIPLLKELVEAAADRIIIMPGCGVNASNIRTLAESTGAKEFHLSARESRPSMMIYRNTAVSMGGTVHIDEYANDITGVERVRSVIHELSK